MRAPFMALAAVCVVATAYLVITKLNAVKPPQQALKRATPVLQKTTSTIPAVNAVAQPVPEATPPPQKLPPYSKRNLALIQPRPVQTVVITGSADTTVSFTQGTQIKVHSSDFVSERTGQPVVGSVKLQVAEYYAMDDILLNNLSTATKDGLLETNGMINIQAFAANGEACKLKKDGSMEIRFPLKNNKPGMELFSGVKKEDGTIIWQPLLINASVIKSNKQDMEQPKPTDNKKAIIDTSINTIPVFAGGLTGIEKNINSIKNPFPIKNTNAMVIADFNVDSAGQICWVKIIKGTDDNYNAALSDAIYQMPEWKPAIKKGREVLMTMRLAVSFNVTNPRLLRFWSCVKSPAQTNFRIDNRYQSWSRLNGDNYARGSYQGSYTGNMLDYYAFTTSSLGWINCDRFYNSPAPQTQLYVAEPVDDNTSMKLIFHNIKSVLNAGITDGKYCFGKVPKGEAVTIIVLKGEKRNLQMAVKTMNISDSVAGGFEFKRVTPDDVKTTMQQFNKLPGAVVKN